MFVGIDIGTSSVRSYTSNHTKTSPIVTHTTSNFITQSSKQIYNAILATLPHNFADTRGLAFAATCSMVVKQVVTIDGKKYLAGYDCGDTPGDDIILWMDTRAKSQCEELNNTKLKKTICKFIPELGLPKLKWLSDNVDVQVYCFELYDWFNYVFQVGYNGELVEFRLGDREYKGNAIDGSIKGWSKSDLEIAGIRENVHVGFSEGLLGSIASVAELTALTAESTASTASTTSTPKELPYLGNLIGRINPNLCKNGYIKNGGIDSYIGWISTITKHSEGIVSMIAGTSTCFILQTTYSDPIEGIWGPFELVKSKSVYSFGQPATGKLFEDLFTEFRHLNPSFEALEHHTKQLEMHHNKSINELIKHYFYYGDKYGNRSPLNSFNMHEMVVDGRNSPGSIGTVFGTDWTSCVIKYNLILEFLCFQTNDIFNRIEGNCRIHSIVMSGSQVKNQRFLNVLGMVTGKRIMVIEVDPLLNVAYGASRVAGEISGDGELDSELEGELGSELEGEPVGEPEYKEVEIVGGKEQVEVLKRKKEVIREMIEFEMRLNGLYLD